MLEARRKGHSIKVRHSKVLFCGSSAVGKSNFINLLLKRKFQKNHIPTGLTESHQLLAKQIAVVKKGDSIKCELEYLDFKKQIKWLRWFLKHQNVHLSQDEQTESENETVNQAQPDFDIGSNDQSSQRLPIEDMVAQPDGDMPLDNPPGVWNLLTFLDTGGQPAFINMLPAVNSSTMITFIIFSMEGGVGSLKNKVTIYGDGPSVYSLDYDYTDLVKMLFSMRKPSKELEMFKQLLVEKDNKSDKKCYLSLVGTKSDLWKDSDAVAKSIYKELEPIIKYTICESSLFPIDGNYFVPVSNCKAGTDDEDPVAAKFRSCIYEYLEKRDVFYIPVVWLILELEILNRSEEENAIHFDEVFRICQEYNLIMNEADVRAALQFFHHIGVFLYYGSDSDMKSVADIIITNYQWLFENLTEIIKAVKSNKDVTKDLRNNGRLTKQVISHIKWKLGKNITETYFLKLLEKLAIISPTKRTHTSDEYFMPCVLPTFSFDHSTEHDLLTKYGTQGEAESLLMHLVYEESDVESCYYDDHSCLLTVGVFCCLINLLLLNNSRFMVQWSDDDSDHCVFNNLIVLYDKNGKYFLVLIDRFMYLEVQIRHRATITESVYPEIKSIITSTLNDVCDKLKLYISHIRVGFLCSEDNKLYWMKNCDEENKDLIMYSRNNKPLQLSKSQKLWFSG